MLLLGHRGAADACHPENTLAAVDRALHQGADGVEVDVRLTADGVLVCAHDASLRRTAGVWRDLGSRTPSRRKPPSGPGWDAHARPPRLRLPK